MLLRSSEEDESLGKSDSQIEELSWTYEGSSQHNPSVPGRHYGLVLVIKVSVCFLIDMVR